MTTRVAASTRPVPGAATRLLHAGTPALRDGAGPVNVPVVRTSTVRFADTAAHHDHHARADDNHVDNDCADNLDDELSDCARGAQRSDRVGIEAPLHQGGIGMRAG